MNTKLFIPAVAPSDIQQLPSDMQDLFQHRILEDPVNGNGFLPRKAKATLVQRKQYILLSSYNRDPVLYPTPTSFSINLQTPINDVASVRVIECTVPNAAPYTTDPVLGIRVNDVGNVSLSSGVVTAIATLEATQVSTSVRLTNATLNNIQTPYLETNSLQRITRWNVAIVDANGDAVVGPTQTAPLNKTTQVSVLLEVVTIQPTLEQSHTRIRGM